MMEHHTGLTFLFFTFICKKLLHILTKLIKLYASVEVFEEIFHTISLSVKLVIACFWKLTPSFRKFKPTTQVHRRQWQLMQKLDIASRCSVSPDGTWLKRECVGLESPVSWSTCVL